VALLEFNEGNGVRCLFLKAGRGIAHTSEGIYLPFAAEGIGCFCFTAAFRAHIAGWENLGFAVWTDFSNQGVTLFF
jgi:hypothetical protein